MKETQYWCIRFYSAAQRANLMQHFKEGLMVVKVAVLEKEWSTGVAWQTAGPMSHPYLYLGMTAPLANR